MRNSLSKSFPAILLAAFGVGLSSLSHADLNSPSISPQLLTDTGFDSGSAPLLSYTTNNTFDRWLEENAALVVGSQSDGVAPKAGDGMLRIREDTLTASQVRQRVSVAAFATQIDLGGVTALANSCVNASVTGPSGGVVLRALNSAQQQIGAITTAFALDGDTSTWQAANASLLLPVNTRYIEYQFSYSNGSFPSGASVYADETSLLLTEPLGSLCDGDGGNQAGCTNCPCSNNAPVGTIGGCLNSAGTGARLAASGDTSASLGSGSTTDLRFTLHEAVPGAFAVLLSGDSLAPTNAANPCFGLGTGTQAASLDGLRCVLQNIRRHGGRAVDSNGEVGVTNSPWGGEAAPAAGIAHAGGANFMAGQTRFFQAYYREDQTQVCMRGINTSQALCVEFTF